MRRYFLERSEVFKKHYGRAEAVPQEVSDQLVAMMYKPHSHITIYVISLSIAAPIFWERSHDIWIVAATVLGVALNLGRIAALHFFEPRRSRPEYATIYWSLLHSLGGGFALTQSFLVARAILLGDSVLITIAVMAVSTYAIGLVVRASAVPQLAIPHLLLLFVPLILVAACNQDKGFLAVAVFLSAACYACVELSLNLHRRLKAQLVAEHQLSLLARTDYLTGLANRAGFEAFARNQANPNPERYALALIDLDNFKPVNDAHGHGAGDELLKEVARRIEAALSSKHFCARLGGDEFAIMFDLETSLNDAIALGDQIVGSLERPFRVGRIQLQISASIGIATSEQSGASFSATLERADKALYQAKNGGRNQTQVFSAPDRKAA
jgi:diguanylate cyclase